MNIAIVDDDKIELETVEYFLRFYIKKFRADYENFIHIETFPNAREFLCYFNPKIYNVLILGSHLRGILKLIGNSSVKVLLW